MRCRFRALPPHFPPPTPSFFAAVDGRAARVPGRHLGGGGGGRGGGKRSQNVERVGEGISSPRRLCGSGQEGLRLPQREGWLQVTHHTSAHFHHTTHFDHIKSRCPLAPRCRVGGGYPLRCTCGEATPQQAPVLFLSGSDRGVASCRKRWRRIGVCVCVCGWTPLSFGNFKAPPVGTA